MTWLSAGTTPSDENKITTVQWEWVSNSHLLVGFNPTTGEELIKFEYEDLLGFAAAIEKIYKLRKEDEADEKD